MFLGKYSLKARVAFYLGVALLGFTIFGIVTLRLDPAVSGRALAGSVIVMWIFLAASIILIVGALVGGQPSDEAPR